ncbi:MAG TPA: pitrilysin family protein [Acidimicrobiales bacterium]|nr:pitrilysin family protein [Acidimicrobiales bacterium]
MAASNRRGGVERHVLKNGLRVVVVPDHSSSLVGLAVVYDVGFRSEPEGRTGFAHLFEHMMFQGSAHAGKLEHIRLVESAGGVFNGHTLGDVTAYYEAVPSGALELALWLEADRMGWLAVTEENLANQVAVVEEEINVNVLNQPYGGFPFILLPEVAFQTFPNSHNGYGAFEDLERATVQEAAGFYRTFYAPSNAVLSVAGDCTAEAVFELAERYFGELRSSRPPRHGPWPEPPPESARRRLVADARAPQPAFVAAYRTPDPIGELDRHLAYPVLAQVLAAGDASRLRSRLMHRDRLVTDVSCKLGIFGIDGFYMRDPVLFQIVVFHAGTKPTDELMAIVREELSLLAANGPGSHELERVAAELASAHWRNLDSVMERSIALACFEVTHGRAELLSELPSRLAAVSADAVAEAASSLLSQYETIVEIEPASKPAKASR